MTDRFTWACECVAIRSTSTKILFTVCFAVVAAFSGWSAEYERFASNIPVVDGWNWEDNAEGDPDSRCHDSLYSSNCPANQPAPRGTAILNASNFGSFTIPSGETITRVCVDVHGGWEANVTGAIRVLITNYPDDPRRDFTIGRTCDWWLGPWDITSLEPGGWTAERVNALQVGVRRVSATSPNSALWIDSFRIIVTTQLIPPSLPDLHVESISHAPIEPLPGELIQITTTVRNSGSAPAHDFYVDLFEDGAAAPGDPCDSDDYLYIDSLAPGTTTVTFWVSYDQPGAKRVWIIADGCDDSAESNETNNAMSRDINVRPPLEFPDLTVTNVTHTPANPVVGQSINVSVTVRNAGTASADFFAVDLFENNASYPPNPCLSDDFLDIDLLPAGSSTTLVFTVAYQAPGSKRMWLIADGCDDVTESNESNNALSHDLTVGQSSQFPDLSISNVTHTPSNPVVGEVVEIRATVRNNGTLATGEFFADLFVESQSFPGDTCDSDDFAYIESLPPGSTTATFYVTYDAPGAKRIWIVADGCNDVAESNESNNGASHDLSVTSTGCEGDVNGDRRVNLVDLATVLSYFGTAAGGTLATGDLDGDGDVDLSDLAALLGHFGNECP